MKKINQMFLIAEYTFIEVFRSKLLILTPILGAFILFFAFIASSFAYGAPSRVALDVGLGLISLANLIISILIGSTLVSKELESKTIYMLISKPISRTSFLIGKILGLLMIVSINALVLCVFSNLIYYYFNGSLSVLVSLVCLFSFLESIIILLVAVFFSLISNVSLTVIFTTLFWIISSVFSETSKIIFLKTSPFLKTIIDTASVILPNLNRLNVKDFLLYEQSLSSQYILSTVLYSLLYSFLLFVLIDFVFKRKDLN